MLPTWRLIYKENWEYSNFTKKITKINNAPAPVCGTKGQRDKGTKGYCMVRRVRSRSANGLVWIIIYIINIYINNIYNNFNRQFCLSEKSKHKCPLVPLSLVPSSFHFVEFCRDSAELKQAWILLSLLHHLTSSNSSLQGIAQTSLALLLLRSSF